jgi:hypothetical protein
MDQGGCYVEENFLKFWIQFSTHTEKFKTISGISSPFWEGKEGQAKP